MSAVHPLHREVKRCKRGFQHLPHIWTDDADARVGTDYHCLGGPVGPADVRDLSRQLPGKVSSLASPHPPEFYADAEREAGQARAMRRILAGQPRHALLALIETVESQARIHGIGGVILPYRMETVTR
jgi:hypothetical protein